MKKQSRSVAPATGTWPLDDEVIQLRGFGTEQVHELAARAQVQTIGASPKCDVVLDKHDGTVAAQHAKLMRPHTRWVLQAIDESTAVVRNRVLLSQFPVLPGIEIGIGKLTLIPESRRSLALRRLLARLLGYGAEHRVEVDRALGMVLRAAAGQRALLLCGEGDVIHVARQLHRHTLE